LKKSNKTKPIIKINKIVDKDDGSVDVSYYINKPAEKLFKKVHKLKKMTEKDLYIRIGEIILKTLDNNE